MSLITSHAFATDFTGIADPAVSAKSLLDAGAGLVVPRRIAGVTCGDRGSWFATSDGDEFHQPAFTPPNPPGVVDTTGAGDVFHGAFSFGLAQGWDPRRCARFASAVAALKCTRLGGRAGIPTCAQAEQLASPG